MQQHCSLHMLLHTQTGATDHQMSSFLLSSKVYICHSRPHLYSTTGGHGHVNCIRLSHSTRHNTAVLPSLCRGTLTVPTSHGSAKLFINPPPAPPGAKGPWTTVTLHSQSATMHNLALMWETNHATIFVYTKKYKKGLNRKPQLR